MVKSFTSAAEDQILDDDGIEFDLDGETLVAFKPTEGQMALLLQAAGRHTSTAHAVAGAMDFFHAVLDDPSAAHVKNRLLDRRDPLTLPVVEEVIEWLVEEWTGHPIQRRSGSTPSRKRSGQKSTRSSPASN